MHPATRSLLRRVASRFPTIVISGRAYGDIAARVRGVPLFAVFGNHGIEPLWAEPASAAVVSGWVRRLRPQLAGSAGLIIEDKTYSLAIHYRGVRDRRRARRVIDEAVADLKGARAIPGRAAVNIIPRRGPDKGAALRHACRAAGCRAAIYVGDDGTDEDAFAALPPNRLLSIRVGLAGDSVARFALPRQRAIDSLLRALLA
jgi:trehalose 6-phosphate phosphatase